MIHAGYFELSLDSLRKLLQLPQEATVCRVAMDYEQAKAGRFSVFVEHPDLPAVAEGEPPLEILPIWEKDGEGKVKWIVLPS